uniref:C-type lectin domain-containing protein n=1 Tax=Acrobeloides nanus TaxID=290746 RepID=A0A914E6Q8_9BILA
MSNQQWKVWDEAKSICNEMQAELLSIDSAFENNEIQRYPTGNDTSCAVQLLNGQYEGQWFNEDCFQQECFMCQMNL